MPYKADICGIYKIVNKATGTCYVGQSQRVKKRLREHFRLLRAGKHQNQHLQHAFNRYGAENFIGELEVECADPHDLDAIEEAFLTGEASFPEPVSYNIAAFAKAPMRGKTHSEVVREKIRLGRNAATFDYGSDAYRKRLSDAQLARYREDPKFVARLKYVVENSDLSYAERARHVGISTSSARKLALKYQHLKGLL